MGDCDRLSSVASLHAIRSRASAWRPPRIALILLLSMALAQAIDRAGVAIGGGLGTAEELLRPSALPELVGLATVGLLGVWLGRREARAPCSRWLPRLATTATVLLGGLAAQELAALALDVGHATGWTGIAAHLGQTVLPVAALAGVGVGLVIGIVRTVRRHVAPIVPLEHLPQVPKAPPVGRAWRGLSVPSGLLLARHLAGRAPPAPAL
jgi:hypothetical protein